MVILLGQRAETKEIILGMFETEDDARRAVHLKEVPAGFLYSIQTPEAEEMLQFRLFDS